MDRSLIYNNIWRDRDINFELCIFISVCLFFAIEFQTIDFSSLYGLHVRSSSAVLETQLSEKRRKILVIHRVTTAMGCARLPGYSRIFTGSLCFTSQLYIVLHSWFFMHRARAVRSSGSVWLCIVCSRLRRESSSLFSFAMRIIFFPSFHVDLLLRKVTRFPRFFWPLLRDALRLFLFFFHHLASRALVCVFPIMRPRSLHFCFLIRAFSSPCSAREDWTG